MESEHVLLQNLLKCEEEELCKAGGIRSRDTDELVPPAAPKLLLSKWEGVWGKGHFPCLSAGVLGGAELQV